MPEDISTLQRKYLRAEAERVRLKHLNAALREQLETREFPGSLELSPLSRAFLPSDEKPPHTKSDTDNLWKSYTASNFGLNKRFKIYIGYLYERMGWNVDYSAGKNLVSRKDNKLIVTLSESTSTVDLNTMYTLLGTAMEYKRDNPSMQVSAMCITSSELVSRVTALAKKFSIAVREKFYFRNFPCVRCKAYSDVHRIYYLPDDEEYLRIAMNPADGDRYCWTPDEAETLRFYRLL